jgi:hypothetical protein
VHGYAAGGAALAGCAEEATAALAVGAHALVLQGAPAARHPPRAFPSRRHGSACHTRRVRFPAQDGAPNSRRTG